MTQRNNLEQPEERDWRHSEEEYQMTPGDQRAVLWLLLICAILVMLVLSADTDDIWWSNLLQNIGAGFIGAIVTYAAFDIFLIRKQHEEYQQKVQPISQRLDVFAMHEIMPLRVYTRMSLWLYRYASSGMVNDIVFHTLVEKARDQAYETGIKLTRFCAPIISALTKEQIFRYATLIDASYELWELLNNLAFETQLPLRGSDFSVQVEQVEKFRREDFESACEFTTDGGYIALDSLLQAIQQDDLNRTSFVPLHTISSAAFRFLSDDDARICKEIISRVHQGLHGSSLPYW
jgi:hypothetical protein